MSKEEKRVLSACCASSLLCVKIKACVLVAMAGQVIVARAIEVSPATASRDLALSRAILHTFAEKCGREYNPDTDALVWSEDYSSFGFRTPETMKGGSKKPVGNFIFAVRSAA